MLNDTILLSGKKLPKAQKPLFNNEPITPIIIAISNVKTFPKILLCNKKTTKGNAIKLIDNIIRL